MPSAKERALRNTCRTFSPAICGNIVREEAAEIAFHILGRRLARDTPEYPVKIGYAVKSAIVGHRRDAFITPVRQSLTGFVDPHFVEERDKGMQRMFLKKSAEGLGRHMRLSGHVFKRDGFVKLLHDEIVDRPDPDPFMVAVGSGLRSR